ncbi:MAG: SRPBCC family protein [Xanthomonadales bacterium]|nr:SRPBCC family protein [Xanthomonadales bacterium]
MSLHFIVALLLTATDPQVDGWAALSEDQRAQLARGEVLVENARTDESGGAVRVHALMDGGREQVWTFIASCESVFRYVDGMRECERLESRPTPDGDATLVRQVVDKGWLVPRVEFTMEVHRKPPDRIEFTLVEGNLRAMEGGWRFADTEAGLLVTHEIRVRPAFPAPRWLVRRSMRRDIPDMLACLRGLVNASGEVPLADDLDRCPKNRAAR